MQKTRNRKGNMRFWLLLNIFFSIVSFMVLQNEVYEDHWYIQSVADGLFGTDNHNYLVLCSNFIITGLINLVSMLGIRIFTFNLLLFIINVGTGAIITYYMLKRFDGPFVRYICFAYLLVVTPLLSFQINFTISSAYGLAGGFILLVYAIDYKKIGTFIFAFIWSIISYSIRIDSFYFLGAFGVALFVHKMILQREEKKEFFLMSLMRLFIKYYKVIIFLVIVGALHVSYFVVINKYEPDFLKWNTVRSQLDDYGIPDYEEYEEEYEELGITKNDYLQIDSWNYQDNNVFTLEKMEALLKMKKEIQKIDYVARVMDGIQKIGGSFIGWVGIFILIYSIYVSISKKKFSKSLDFIILFLVYAVLMVYFGVVGRLIVRIASSVFLFYFIFSVYFLGERLEQDRRIEYLKERRVRKLEMEKKREEEDASEECVHDFDEEEEESLTLEQAEKRMHNQGSSMRMGVLATTLFTFLVVSFQFPGMESSCWRSYSYQIQYCRCNFKTIFYKEKPDSRTYDKNMYKKLMSDKDNVYFQLINQEWMQHYPLAVKSIFECLPEGSADNVAFMGQYMNKLQCNQNVLKKYNINDMFKEVYRDNVRVQARVYESKGYVKRLTRYLDEHYFDDVDYSVEDIESEAMVVNYNKNVKDVIDYTTREDYKKSRKVRVHLFKNSQVSTEFNEVIVNSDETDYGLDDSSELFLRITGKDGKQFTYSRMKDMYDTDQYLFMIDKTLMDEVDMAKIEVLKKEGDKYYLLPTRDFELHTGYRYKKDQDKEK